MSIGDYMDIFSERLKEMRTKRELTQQQLADLIEVSRHTVINYEVGRRMPDLEILKNLCEKLNVSSDYLLGLIDKRTNIK